METASAGVPQDMEALRAAFLALRSKAAGLEIENARLAADNTAGLRRPAGAAPTTPADNPRREAGGSQRRRRPPRRFQAALAAVFGIAKGNALGPVKTVGWRIGGWV